jgi:hypothetical protein
MSDTPISDFATRCAEYGLSVPIETARQLELMCEELASNSACINQCLIDATYKCSLCVALARWQAMKDAAK